jgi:hypothetical protein
MKNSFVNYQLNKQKFTAELKYLNKVEDRGSYIKVKCITKELKDIYIKKLIKDLNRALRNRAGQDIDTLTLNAIIDSTKINIDQSLEKKFKIHKIRFIIVVFLFAFFSCSSNKEVYNTAAWGMSIDEVMQLYKVKPQNELISDKLVYIEKTEDLKKSFKVTYEFNSKTGLEAIVIEADFENYIYTETDRFENNFFNKSNIKLFDEIQFAKKDGETIVYDKIYLSDNFNIRSILTKKSDGSKWHYLKIILIPGNLMFTTLPSKK